MSDCPVCGAFGDMAHAKSYWVGLAAENATLRAALATAQEVHCVRCGCVIPLPHCIGCGGTASAARNEELLERFGELEAERDAATAARDAAEARVREAREALEFYADEHSYIPDRGEDHVAAILWDDGDRARHALAALDRDRPQGQGGDTDAAS